MTRQVSREIITLQDMEAAQARIHASPELQVVGAADLVIEAATESEEVKKSIFRALAPHLGPDTLLASNTSSISITRLAAATDRPERFAASPPMRRPTRPPSTSPGPWARPPPTPRTSRPSSSTASWCR
jgi:3-hydroxyacyl-CoA dehydrogenase